MDKKVEALLYQIMSGYTKVNIKGQVYLVENPTIFQKYRATEIFQDVFDDTAFESWMTDYQNKALLISSDFVSKEIDENFKEIENRIDDLKVELYESAFDSSKRDKVRNTLVKVRDKHSEMLDRRHMFDAMTREGYAELIKMQYVVAMSLRDVKGRKLFDDDALSSASFPLLDRVIRELNEHRITEGQFRQIARSELWRGYWQVGKAVGHPFGKPTIDLTDDQRLLCQITRMYDSAHEHPECPGDGIIEDDDAFDGWMIKERRKNERERNEQALDDVTRGKHKDAHEVFIIAKNKDDARKIDNLNDTQARVVKKQREQALKAKGKLFEGELPDQQARILMEKNRLMAEHIRGNKGK